MLICFIGSEGGTARQRAQALARLGHEVVCVDQFHYLGKSKWASRWLHHTGGLGAELYADGPLRRRVFDVNPDLIWVDHGACLGPGLIRSLRALGRPIVNYMVDNPWSPIYRIKCHRYRHALPFYDLAVVTRTHNAAEARAAGARRVLVADLCADEVAHAPRELDQEMRKAFSSDVAFIGTYLPERGPFLAELLRRGVPISIWGDRWNRAPEWNVLKVHWRGPGLDEAGYAAAVQSSKLCLGLLSKEVGDTCTTRSIEIPALGGLLCAERTSEHLALYRENEEAVFWADAEECSTICLELLADAPLREAIARSGRQRALRNGRFNETAIAEILTSATSCVQVESTFSASRAWRRRSG